MGDRVFDVPLHFLVSSICQNCRRNREISVRFGKLALLCGFLATTARGGLAEERLKLVPRTARNQSARVQIVQEVKGDLKLNADGRQVTRLPFSARGEMDYDQRTVAFDADHRRDVRLYHQATAQIRVGEANQRAQLSPLRRTIVVDCLPKRTQLYSPLGPLTRDQLELIEIQGNPALLDRLLPTEPIAVGDDWQHDDALVAQLFGLDVVRRNELTSTLRAVERDLAVIDFSGTLRGAVAGVPTDVEVKAKYHFERHQQRISWLAMTIKENRSIGHASPGFEVTARIRTSIDPAEVPVELRDSALADLDLKAGAGSLMLEFTSAAGGFRFLHARPWQVMVDRHDVSVLRMIEKGDLIAQCNASKLPNLPAGKRVTLAEFQADIQRALAKEFGEFQQATQGTSADGYRVLRVVVAGQAADLPIQWRYYHISNDAGRQVSVVFTMDAKLIERFAEADRGIITSFAFAEGSADPTVAPVLGPERAAANDETTGRQRR